MTPRSMTPEARLEHLLAGCEPQPDGCWIWRRNAGAERRYGMAYDGKRYRRVHRLIYELIHGPLAEGLELDHLCRVTLCVNPDHLEPVTHRENVLRGTAPTARNAIKTHCVRGHEFSPENTRIRMRDGHQHRVCIACAKSRKRVA